MPQAQFRYNGETYLVDSDTNQLYRMSQQGPVLMSQANPGWNTAEMRQAMSQALSDAAQGRTATPRNPSAGSGGGLGGFGDYVAPGVDQAAAPSSRSTARGVGIKPDGSLGWVDAQGNEVNPDGSPIEGAQQLRPLAPAPNTAPSGSQQVTSGIPGMGTSPAQPIQQTTPLPNAVGPSTPGQTAPDSNAVEKRILGSLGRSGWTVTGRSDEMKNQSVLNRDGVATNQLTPTGNVVWAISGPGGRNSTITVHPSATTAGDFDVVEPPKDEPNDPTKTMQLLVGGTIYTPDPNNPNGPFIPRALDETAQAQARANTQKTLSDIGYTSAQIDALSRKTGPEIQQILAQAGLSTANAQKVQQDMAIAQAELPGKLAQQGATLAGTTATTARTGAETQQIQTATGIAQAKAPAEIAELEARTKQALAAAGASDATVQKVLQEIRQGNAPTTQATTLGAGNQFVAKTDPNTGEITWQDNRNFQPKTMADVAARAGQLDSLARAKKDEVFGKVNGSTYTADDAGKEFMAWWEQKIQPNMGQLQAAQDEAARKAAQDQMAARTNAYTAANAAGSQQLTAIKDYAAMHPVKDPAAFASVVGSLSQGNVPSDLSGIMYEAPDPMEAARQGTMNALKYIDPTAAAATGAPPPNPQAVDWAGKLGAQNYLAPGVQPPLPQAPPAPAPEPAPVAAGMPVPAAAGADFKPGWAGSDPRLSGQLDPYASAIAPAAPAPAASEAYLPPAPLEQPFQQWLRQRQAMLPNYTYR